MFATLCKFCITSITMVTKLLFGRLRVAQISLTYFIRMKLLLFSSSYTIAILRNGYLLC